MISFLMVFALLSLPVCQAQSLSQQRTDFSELEKVALAELKDTNTPGAAVAIVSGDRIVFAKGFGVSNIETGAPVTPEMLFRLGSTTKMFTAAALVTLAEQGKIKLDAPIGNYVKGLLPKVSALTAHQLLTHTAGLRDDSPSTELHDDGALASYIHSWKDDHFFTEPGKIYSYANPGFHLIGLVIQELSGKPYADAMSELVFKPLGMERTTFRPLLAMTYPFSQGHVSVGKEKPAVARPFPDNVKRWPSGSIFSSVNNLSRFVIAFMNGGKLDGKPVLSPSVIAKLSTPYVSEVNRRDKYGYALHVYSYRGVKVVEHSGTTPGFGSLITMVPEHRFAVIVVANKTGEHLPRTAERAMELMLPLMAKAEPKPALVMSETEMASYAGVYDNSHKIEVYVKDQKLFLREENVEMAVTKIGDYRFTVARGPRRTGEPQELALVPDANGKIEYLHLGGRAYKRQPGSK